MLRQEDLFVIHHLRRQGLGIKAIARELGLDRKTVRKYLKQGLDRPVYGPRRPLLRIIDPFVSYLRERLAAFPELSGKRLWREIQDRGFTGGYTSVKECVGEIRPPRTNGFEHRFETPPGHQAQVDFAHFLVEFTRDPGRRQSVWLFTMILGHCRFLFGRYGFRQNLEAFLRGHLAAFADFSGVPGEVLYDRMKVAVLNEDEDGSVIFHPALLDLARHFGFVPRACRPYRAKTKGKVERPYRYIRQDFFLGREFADLDDLNTQFTEWLSNVANRRRHGTTGRIISEALADEQPSLKPLPSEPYRSVLRLERRITRDGVISIDGNAYSVPDGTRQRVVEVQTLPTEIRIYEKGDLIAVHEPLSGRGERRVAPGHRQFQRSVVNRPAAVDTVLLEVPGLRVPERCLEVYDTIGRRLACGEDI